MMNSHYVSLTALRSIRFAVTEFFRAQQLSSITYEFPLLREIYAENIQLYLKQTMILSEK